jgi:hypothetical protein
MRGSEDATKFGCDKYPVTAIDTVIQCDTPLNKLRGRVRESGDPCVENVKTERAVATRTVHRPATTVKSEHHTGHSKARASGRPRPRTQKATTTIRTQTRNCAEWLSAFATNVPCLILRLGMQHRTRDC